jgi:DNA polymerase-1
LIAPGLLAPPIVCVQFMSAGMAGPGIRHRDSAKPIIEEWLAGDALLVGHNAAYDFGVIAAQWPDLVPAIFAKYDRDEISDTLLREQLLQIARGTFRSVMGSDGELSPVKYSLDDCCARHFGRRLAKDGWRLMYRAFDQEPDIADWPRVARHFQARVRSHGLPEWAKDVEEKDVHAMLASDPDEPVRYALADATTTLALYESQERIARERPGVLQDQFRQARAAFGLHLSSCWGLYTDGPAVDALEKNLTEELEALKFELQAEGLIRPDGTADTKVAMAAMEKACAEEGIPVARTPGGKVSLGSDACDRLPDESIIGRYSQFLTIRKQLSNDVKMLRSGCEVPIQPRYDMADTGRTRCSKPNIQAISRGAGIREAFRPREGTVFIQADFEGLELHTFAAWCLEKIGWSKLAEDLNAGRDAHLAMAAVMMGITYEEALARKKAGDPEIKEMRQRAKAINFGRPGGLGDKKFVAYAKNNYGVVVTLQEAAQYNAAWKRRVPEAVEHFRLAAMATADGEGDEETLFTGRQGGQMRYSALCNRRFQALGADCAKEALWRVTRACYAEPTSPLFGCRVVAFVHDEIIAECTHARAPAAAKELGRLMCEGANIYLSKVPVRTLPLVMTVWSKSAEPRYDADGELLPWSPEWAAEERARKAALAAA